jgi:hypothetical protein
MYKHGYLSMEVMMTGHMARAEEQEYIVTCTPIARQRVGKQVPAKTDSW